MKKFLMKCKEYIPFALYVPAVIWQILFLGIPVAIMLYFAFGQGGGAPWYHFTTQHFRDIFDVLHVKILLRTVYISLLVALICLCISFPVAYYVAIHVHERWKNVFLFFLTLPFWTSFLVQMYSWFFLLDRYGLINMVLLRMGIISEPISMIYNMPAVTLVTVYCYMPFMVLPLYNSIEKLSSDYVEASMDLGASWIATFWHITIPLCAEGIKTGFLLVLVPVFGEFAIPSLIGGGKYMFAGSLMSHYILVVRNIASGAAFTLTSAGTLLVIIVAIFCIPRIGIYLKRRLL